MTVSLNFYPLKANINALVQSIERPLHLIYENLFSIKQYQFPFPPPQKKKKKLAWIYLKNHAVLRHCVRRRLRLYIYPRRPEVMVGRYRECRAYRQVCGQRGRNLTMTMAISPIQCFPRQLLEYWILCRVFCDFLTRARKTWIPISRWSLRMTPGVPAHLDLAIPGPYVHISYINCKKHSIDCTNVLMFALSILIYPKVVQECY